MQKGSDHDVPFRVEFEREEGDGILIPADNTCGLLFASQYFPCVLAVSYMATTFSVGELSCRL